MKRLVACISCHSYLYPKQDEGAAHHSGDNQLRSDVVRNTWYRNCKGKIDIKFFFGPSDRAPQTDEIFLNCRDDYYGLPDKVQKVFQWALEHGYDYILKIDDDVWLYVDRMLKDVTKPPDYRGFVLESISGRYTSGTAYWLSRKAMQVVVDAIWDPADWAEDKWVGKTLAEHQIYPVYDERFQCCHCDDCKKRFPKDSRISTHLANPREMYELMEKNNV